MGQTREAGDKTEKALAAIRKLLSTMIYGQPVLEKGNLS